MSIRFDVRFRKIILMLVQSNSPHIVLLFYRVRVENGCGFP